MISPISVAAAVNGRTCVLDFASRGVLTLAQDVVRNSELITIARFSEVDLPLVDYHNDR